RRIAREVLRTRCTGAGTSARGAHRATRKCVTRRRFALRVARRAAAARHVASSVNQPRRHVLDTSIECKLCHRRRRRSRFIDRQAYSYHPVGYMQISPEVMHAQVGTIYEQQKAIGYESVLIEGERESLDYMKALLGDWQARNVTSVLHEKRGGYANNLAAVQGLAKKATALGVELITG